VYEICDGDGSAFGASGPQGSAEVEKLWKDYVKNDVDITTKPSEFNDRSNYSPFLDFGIAAGELTSGADGVKTQEEVALYGGTAGQTYNPNYHTDRDILVNYNVGVGVQMAKEITHAVATYGRNCKTLPANVKRSEKSATQKFPRKGRKWSDLEVSLMVSCRFSV
jgi:carboxypeptidase Q